MEKYSYSQGERFAMVVLTGLSNFWGIPGSYGALRRGDYYHAFLGFYTIFVSFIYHLLDSLDIRMFLFDDGHWHRLDNLGSISGMIALLVYFLDCRDRDQEELLNLIGLFVTLICQEGYPWDVTYTFVPLLPFLFLVLRKYRRGEIRITNRVAFNKGRNYLALGVVCFIVGLNENADYLRFVHSLWHFFGYISIYYIFQTRYEENQEIYISQFLLPGNKKLKFL